MNLEDSSLCQGSSFNMSGAAGTGSILPQHLKPWAMDFITGNVSSNKDPNSTEEEGEAEGQGQGQGQGQEQGQGVGQEVGMEMEGLKMECGKLSEENQVLKRCLRLLRDNSALETTALLSAVVCFCDSKFRRKFADGLEGVVPGGDEGGLGPGEMYKETQQFRHVTTQSSAHQDSSAQQQPSTTSEEVEERYERVTRSYGEPPRQSSSKRPKQQAVKGYRENVIHEAPVRDGPVKKKSKHPKMPCCPAICPKSPPVSLGGRQLRSPEAQPYFYPSEPDSKHLASHMQTQTAFTSDLEYDALYLRSLALAAGYRALAKGLEAKEGEGGKVKDKKYKYVSMDKLCRVVSSIPPYIMYKRHRQVKPVKLIHTCVSPKPTYIYPFSREGQPQETPVVKIRDGKKEKLNMTPTAYYSDEQGLAPPVPEELKDEDQFHPKGPLKHRSISQYCKKQAKAGGVPDKRRATWGGSEFERAGHKMPPAGSDRPSEQVVKEGEGKAGSPKSCRSPASSRSPPTSPQRSRSGSPKSPQGTPRGVASPGSAHSRPRSPRSPGKQGSDYDFQAVVNPIIDQARQSLEQVNGKEAVSGDLAGYSVQHTHKEYQYKDDGTAVVQSDVYKKSFNWGSDEEGNEGQKQDGGMLEIAAGYGADEHSATIQDSIRDSDDRTITPGEDKTSESEDNKARAEAEAQAQAQAQAQASASGERAGLQDDPNNPNPESLLPQNEEDMNNSEGKEEDDNGGRVHWDPQFQNANQTGKGDDESTPFADSSNNKTNNFISLLRERHKATSQWLEDCCEMVSNDGDFANHCSGHNPNRALTPRHSPSTASPDLPQAGDRVLVGLDTRDQRGGDSNWAPSLFSPRAWNRNQSRVTPSVLGTDRWCPSPRLDFFPVNPNTDSSLWLTPSYGGGGSSSTPRASCSTSTSRGSSKKSLLAEVAFQLERRILDYVFANSLPDLTPGAFASPGGRDTAAQRWRLHGYTVSNIGEMINQQALAGSSYSRGTERMLRERLRTMLDLLTPMGFDLLEHGTFSQSIINKYGLLPSPCVEVADPKTGQASAVGLSELSVADVQNFIVSASESHEEQDTLLLIFDCLRMMAIEDGRDLFL